MGPRPFGRLTAVSEFWEYPGEPVWCREVRHRTRAALASFSRVVDEAELVVSELFGNACRHTRSGEGGKVAVSVSALRTGLVFLSVADDGPRLSPGTRRPLAPRVVASDPDACAFRGLGLVAEVTDDWGYWVTEEGGHAVWALFEPPPPAFPHS
ncbi:ATP-binding protein [Actinorugispora endophytica]|uniref:Histidine kinase-like protein n=1 Tax=Actinorugispora endophytica TaxID=1605990 RepID=A0A4R6V5S9_9ACTN|nr:ATP-binding protein [Actinorugispora endophytica]TDQ53758.1 histidine kinase-like protein [Actinorugispora endophytica]